MKIKTFQNSTTPRLFEGEVCSSKYCDQKRSKQHKRYKSSLTKLKSKAGLKNFYAKSLLSVLVTFFTLMDFVNQGIGLLTFIIKKNFTNLFRAQGTIIIKLVCFYISIAFWDTGMLSFHINICGTVQQGGLGKETNFQETRKWNT